MPSRITTLISLFLVWLLCHSLYAESIFTNQVPAELGGGSPFELGTQFKTLKPGHLNKVRIYTHPLECGKHIVRIWDLSTSRVLAGPFTWDIPAGTPAGWQEYDLNPIVPVNANTDYIVSVSNGYLSGNYYFPYTQWGFNAPINNSNLVTYAGSGFYSTTPGYMPQSGYNKSNYFRDVNFIPSLQQASCKALLLYNSNSPYVKHYHLYIKPYFDHLGIPNEAIDLKSTNFASIDLNKYAIIVPGHYLTLPDSYYPSFLVNLEAAIKKGVGLCSFDARLFDFSCDFNESVGAISNSNLPQVAIVDNLHYISSYHGLNEVIGFASNWAVTQNGNLKNGVPLVRSGSTIVLEAAQYSDGRIVRWNGFGWMFNSVNGPMDGMDDLVWKGIAWAARKPFVMQGTPPMVTMRVDDVWGSWGTSDPLEWVSIASDVGFKPWLGLDVNTINNSPSALASLKSKVCHRKDSNNNDIVPIATASPHAWECPHLPAPMFFMYYDHYNLRPYDDARQAYYFDCIRTWFRDNNIPISKYVVPHYYEYGANTIDGLCSLGIEFIGTCLQADAPLLTWTPALIGGPFFANANRDPSDGFPACIYPPSPRPMYYADFLRVDNRPELSRRLFNVLVEIRDQNGYEWAPTDNNEDEIKGSITDGIIQLKRSFQSMTYACLFTHEFDYIEKIHAVGNWRRLLEGVRDGMTTIEPKFYPEYVSTEYACQYVRAKTMLTITDVVATGENGGVTIYYSGINDMPTKCIRFRDQNGTTISDWVDIPMSSSVQTSCVSR